MRRNLGMWVWFVGISALAIAGLFLMLTNVAMPIGRFYSRYLEAPDGSFLIAETNDAHASTRLFILDPQAYTASFWGYTGNRSSWSLDQLYISPDSQQIAHYTQNDLRFYSPQGDFLRSVEVPTAIAFEGIIWTRDSDGFAYAVIYRDWCGGSVGTSRVTDLFFVQLANAREATSFRLPCNLRLRNNAASRMYWSADGQRFIFAVFDTTLSEEAFYMLDLSQSPPEPSVLLDGIDSISDIVHTRTGIQSGMEERFNARDFTIIKPEMSEDRRMLGIVLLACAIVLMFARSGFLMVSRTATKEAVHYVRDESEHR